MIGRLNHVAIAVRDLAAATALYRDTLGATVSEPLPQPAHGVTVVFIELPNTKIELLEPLGAETLITVQFGNAEWVARVAASYRRQPGEAVTLHVQPAQMHLFDAESGLALGR